MRHRCALPPGREADRAVGDGVAIYRGRQVGHEGPDAIGIGCIRAVYAVALDQVRDPAAVPAVIGVDAAGRMGDGVVQELDAVWIGWR